MNVNHGTGVIYSTYLFQGNIRANGTFSQVPAGQPPNTGRVRHKIYKGGWIFYKRRYLYWSLSNT